MPGRDGRRDLLGRIAVVALAVGVDLVTWDGDQRLRDGGMLPLWVIPVLTILAYSTLLLRWRHPRRVLIVQWCFSIAGSLAVPEFQPVAGLMIALHAVASRRPLVESALWLALILVPLGVHSYNTAAKGIGDRARDWGLLLLIWAMISITVWAIGRVSYASARRAWRLRELQAAEAAEAVAAERLRLARELHDIVSHAVTGMTLQAAGAQALLRPVDEGLRGSLAAIESMGVQAMSELHRMLGLLHSAGPDAAPGSAEPGPTLADIAQLVALAKDAGRDIHLEQVGTPVVLDPSVETAAYRVVQEGLTNSAKHAGSASAVTVRLHWADGKLEVGVTDSGGGAGLSPERRAQLSSGNGLRGLTERVILIGGTLTSGPTDDGFALTAWLPGPWTAPETASATSPATSTSAS
ncbi:MAG: histidine kinase [Propionibacteriaceae bacterium]